ncbi:hypothetical protein [Methanobrevibacter arboriphilus]|nr:hypothetical protein [Methanobrevibacter arboriphilus]
MLSKISLSIATTLVLPLTPVTSTTGIFLVAISLFHSFKINSTAL